VQVFVPVIIFAWDIEWQYSPILCAAIFMVAAWTDWLDGFLARKMGISTVFGAFLDPVADKVMVSACMHVHTHTQAHKNTHACIKPYTCTHMPNAHTHTNAHACIKPYTCTHMYTNTSKRTCARKQTCISCTRAFQVTTALILLTTSPPAPLAPKQMVLPVAIIICREITMSSLREWAAASGGGAHKVRLCFKSSLREWVAASGGGDTQGEAQFQNVGSVENAFGAPSCDCRVAVSLCTVMQCAAMQRTVMQLYHHAPSRSVPSCNVLPCNFRVIVSLCTVTKRTVMQRAVMQPSCNCVIMHCRKAYCHATYHHATVV